ncbi:MAG: ABC transporter permease [Chloroflexota bacterium]
MQQVVLALGNEIRKRLLIMWDYKFNVLTQVVTVAFIFIGASFFIQGGELQPGPLAPMLLGYMVWFYARIIIMNTSNDLMAEAQAGTLEQMYMSPNPTSLLLLGRLLALLISTTLIVIVPTLILGILLGIRIPLRWEGVPVLFITLAGLFGFTLALSGIALVFKQTDALADLVQNALLFLTGSLLPVSRFPEWLEAISRTLPITQGIIVLREVMLENISLTASWMNGGLVWLIVHSTSYVCVGFLIFKWCERIAKKQGSLGHY